MNIDISDMDNPLSTTSATVVENGDMIEATPAPTVRATGTRALETSLREVNTAAVEEDEVQSTAPDSELPVYTPQPVEVEIPTEPPQLTDALQGFVTIDGFDEAPATEAPATRTRKPVEEAKAEVPATRTRKPVEEAKAEVPATRTRKPVEEAKAEVPATRTRKPVEEAKVEVPATPTRKPVEAAPISIAVADMIGATASPREELSRVSTDGNGFIGREEIMMMKLLNNTPPQLIEDRLHEIELLFQMRRTATGKARKRATLALIMNLWDALGLEE